jgi:hypothetical protein
MNVAPGVILLTFAMLGAVGYLSDEPEDFYGLIFWSVLLLLLCAIWLWGSMSLLRHRPVSSLSARAIAAMLAILGTMFYLGIVTPLDRLLSFVLAPFCLFSALVLVSSVSRRPAAELQRWAS